MGLPQKHWLQRDLANSEATTVELFAFSNQGSGVILMAGVPLQQGASVLLMMQAQGAGLSHRPVRLCWHRPHLQEPERQVTGQPGFGLNPTTGDLLFSLLHWPAPTG